MIQMSLADAATAVGGRLVGPDRGFDGVSTDTRTLRAGELYCALRGPRHDGHDFVAAACSAGASGSIVEKFIERDTPQVVVNDSQTALGRLANRWRRRFSVPLVAITGSNGKTTVKEMLAAILSCQGKVLATRGNLNNEIGVPKVLFELAGEHDYAVIEMGANHAGEIGRLTELAEPTVGVVTLCAAAHLQGFGDLSGVARAKGELFEKMAADATAVINSDDAFAEYWRGLNPARQVLMFGLNRSAEVSATEIINHGPGRGTTFVLRVGAGSLPLRLRFDGRHNVMNALAAAACAHALGVPIGAIKAGLETANPVTGRLQIKRGIRATQIIDDTYNANPASLKAAISVLADGLGERWLVLGDMGELGGDAAALHREMGLVAKRAEIDHLYTVGRLSLGASDVFGQGAKHFEDREALIGELRKSLTDNATVLVKGSRAMEMELVVEALCDRGAEQC